MEKQLARSVLAALLFGLPTLAQVPGFDPPEQSSDVPGFGTLEGEDPVPGFDPPEPPAPVPGFGPPDGGWREHTYSDEDEFGRAGGHDNSNTGFQQAYPALDPQADSDGDGLSNLFEWSIRTHPLRADTDFGGVKDGAEVSAGKNPRWPLDDPPALYDNQGVTEESADQALENLQNAIDQLEQDLQQAWQRWYGLDAMLVGDFAYLRLLYWEAWDDPNYLWWAILYYDYGGPYWHLVLAPRLLDECGYSPDGLPDLFKVYLSKHYAQVFKNQGKFRHCKIMCDAGHTLLQWIRNGPLDAAQVHMDDAEDQLWDYSEIFWSWLLGPM